MPSLFSALRTLGLRPSGSHAQCPHLRQLVVEPLETRRLLAADNLASIAGVAFSDLADDGITSDDVLLANVTVNLYRDGGNGLFGLSGDDTPVGTTLTAVDGTFRFDRLQAGTYFVEQLPWDDLMQKPGTSVRQVIIRSLDAQGTQGIMIDSFDITPQSVIASSEAASSAAVSDSAGEALGGERDLFVELTLGMGEVQLRSNPFGSQVLQFDSSAAVVGTRRVTWDGADRLIDNGTQLQHTGLGGVDITEGGRNTALTLEIGADHDAGSATIDIHTDANNASRYVVPIPATGGAATTSVIVALADFEIVVGNGADFTNVGAIQIELDGVSSVDGQFDLFRMIGPTVKAIEFANFQPLSLGNLVWLESDNSGTRQVATEHGIPGVTVDLFRDSNVDGRLALGVDTLQDVTVTDTNGDFLFENLFPGQFIVQLSPTNFAQGGVLWGLTSSSGNEPTPDPDNDLNGDDNGDLVAGLGIVSQAVLLTGNGEPANDGDGDTNSNLTVDFGLVAQVDLAIVKSDNVDPVVPGENLIYTLVVTNNGPSDATGVIVSDTLPDEVSYVTGSATQGSISEAGQNVTAELGALDVGDTAMITVEVTVDSSTTETFLNTAEVRGDQPDLFPQNNRDDEPTSVRPEIDLAIEKSDNSDPVLSGELLDYTLVVSNHGPSDATGVTVVDTLPAGVHFRLVSSSQGSASSAGNIVTADLGELADGQLATIDITVQVDPSTIGTIVNVAEVSAHEPETNLENNVDDEPTVVEPALGSISGKVFLDRDDDGNQDSNDPPLQGVTVELFGTTVTGAIIERRLLTEVDGTYLFDTLPTGVYTVTETQPDLYLDGKETPGTLSPGVIVPATVLDDAFANISLTGGANVTDYNFAETLDSPVSKRRFLVSSR